MGVEEITLTYLITNWTIKIKIMKQFNGKVYNEI